MSLPIFPIIDPPLTREGVINQVISSIAMEELGLSHIINAEGEKIQYVLGTLSGSSGPAEPVTIDNILEINKSVRETLDSATQNQMFLKSKLSTVLATSTTGGITGPTGPTGPAGSGMFVPLSSGNLIRTSTTASNRYQMSLIAYGTASLITASTDQIELYSDNQLAFSIPTACKLTSISTYFTLDDINASAGTNVELYFQVYISETPNNTFTAITGTTMSLGTLVNSDPQGKIMTANLSGLDIDIPANSRIATGIYCTAPTTVNVAGAFSGGLKFD